MQGKAVTRLKEMPCGKKKKRWSKAKKLIIRSEKEAT